MLAALVGVAVIAKPDRTAVRVGLTLGLINGSDHREMSRELLDESLELGQRYMLANQKPEGNFTYEYDWREDAEPPTDGEVRQAGALWGLALLYAETRDPEAAKAADRGLAFFSKHSVQREDGARFVAYPGRGRAQTGTTALTALALVETLRARSGELPPERLRQLNAELDGYLKYLLASRAPDGRWQIEYDKRTGAPAGPSSSYYDGESLLVLAKAARYLDRADLIPTVLEAADAGYELNVRQALAEDADSDTTKGYYQWSSMAFFEIGTSGWPGTEKYQAYVLELADWQIHVHQTLRRNRNTAYAYEGLTHAYELARRQGDKERVETYGAVIDIGLRQLTGWQVGHSLADGVWMGTDGAKARAFGGVQNSWANPVLRIDVVQHQMHAVILARRYVCGPPSVL
jgi:UDP-N-acetylmuramoyl-tripeptide--D-alanyl-D-alanine ligase